MSLIKALAIGIIAALFVVMFYPCGDVRGYQYLLTFIIITIVGFFIEWISKYRITRRK